METVLADIPENFYLDDKNRRIMDVCGQNRTAKYYSGPDAKGIVCMDDFGEYIVINGEKRYWRGIINFLPDEAIIAKMRDFNFFILKPDVESRGLSEHIKSMLYAQKFTVVSEKCITFDQQLICSMYPYFFSEEWETRLFKYFTSGVSRCLLVTGGDVYQGLFNFRNQIRNKYRNDLDHAAINLVHCADTKADALREALLIFKMQEVIDKIGVF